MGSFEHFYYSKGLREKPSMVADLLQQISSIFPVNTLLYLGASTYFFYLSSLTIFNCRLHYALQLSSINYSHLRSSRAKKLTLLSPHCEDALKTFYLRVVLLEWSKRTSPPALRPRSLVELINLNSARDNTFLQNGKSFRGPIHLPRKKGLSSVFSN